MPLFLREMKMKVLFIVYAYLCITYNLHEGTIDMEANVFKNHKSIVTLLE